MWGSASGLGVAMAAFALGSANGCDYGDADVCAPSQFPDATPPPTCYPGFCVPVGDPCFKDGWCCSGACDKGVCAAASGATDGGDASVDGPIGTCAGQCLPLPPDDWNFPDLVWIGPVDEAPPCPEGAPVLGYEKHADLDASVGCGACRCDPPTGSCGLPAAVTISSGACDEIDGGAVGTPFDPPNGWDGGCTSNDGVDAGEPCDGSPCARSLTIAPPTVQDEGCTPSSDSPPPVVPATWATIARACRGAPPGWCSGAANVCAPHVVPGFHACIQQAGDWDCSANRPYTEKHLVYDGFQDTRTCSACSCGPPSGSVCSAKISFYPDSACAADATYVETIDSTGAECHDLAPGAALAAMSAASVAYTPGACQPSGGQPMGSAEPVGPSTLCCIPPPEPASSPSRSNR